MRKILALLIASLCGAAAGPVFPTGGSNFAPTTPPYYILGLLDYGQSWDSNCWNSFAAYGINPQPTRLLTPHYHNATVPKLNGPLTNGAGISIPGTIDGITGYQSSDCISIGRSAVLAQQLYRQARNLSSQLLALFQWCFAYPGSTWTSGGGGGLAPGATFTGSVTSNTLTAASGLSGVIAPGQQLVGSGVPASYYVLGGGSGTGGLGDYPVGIAQTTLSETLTTAHATFVGSIGGGTPTNVVTVLSITSGTITAGDTVTGTGVLANTVLDAFGGNCEGSTCTGAGGAGTYSTTVGTPLTVGSETLNTNGISWANQLTILSAINSGAIPRGPIEGVCYTAMEFTQGGAADNTVASKLSNLTDMVTDEDALGITCGTARLNYYLQLPAAISTATSFTGSAIGTEQFCINNAPGAGGPYSGRVFCTNPSYAWQFVGTDNIHTGAYGTAQWGASVGYVRFQVEDLGNTNWTPLWRALNTSPIVCTTCNPQTVTLQYSRPASTDFATAPLSWQSSANDGIKVWPQYGYDVKYGSATPGAGTDCPVTPTISGMTIVLTVISSPCWTLGQPVEASFAWYGPGGSNPGNNSGVGGNLAMAGPASGLMPGAPFLMWAWPSDEVVTAP